MQVYCYLLTPNSRFTDKCYFTEELQKTEWESCFEPNVHNPELAYSNFLELYSSCYNKCFPLKAIKVRKKDS